MKSFRIFRNTLLITLIFIFVACEKQEHVLPNATGSLILGADISINPEGRVSSYENLSLIITVQDELGETVIDQEVLDLSKVNNEFITKPVSLLVGNYSIVQFVVINEFSEAIYINPLEGSPLAYLVSDPSPIDFSISADASLKLIPQVISAENQTPEAFGYTSFSFEYVESFDFLLTVLAYDYGSGKYEMIDEVSLEIRNSEGTVLYSNSIPAGTNKITLPSNHGIYQLILNKEFWKPSVVSLTEEELKLHFKNDDLGPIQIYMGVYLWDKTYGGSSNELSSAFCNTSDGGYIFTGETQSTDGDVIGGPGTWVLKIDRFGNTEWQKVLPDDVGNFDIIQTIDGGYICTGSLGTVKMDQNGNEEFQVPVNGRRIIQNSNHDYIAVDRSEISKISQSGLVEWTRIHSSMDGRCLLEDQFDKNSYFIGEYNSSNSAVGIAKIDSAGNLIMQQPMIGDNFYPYDIVQNNTGDMIIVGIGFKAVKVGRDGVKIWSRAVGVNTDGEALKIMNTFEGYVLAGHLFNSENSLYDGYILEIDESGNRLWDQFTEQAQTSFVYGLGNDIDGDYVLGGRRRVQGSQFNYWAQKIEP